MSMKSAHRHAAKTFTDQFELTGSGWIYRYNGKGAPITVTAAERDGFIDDFERNLPPFSWGIVVITVAIVSAVVGVSVAYDIELVEGWAFVIAGLVVVLYFIAFRWLWNVPKHALVGRAAVGFALTREEARRRRLARTSWSQLGGAVGGTALIVWFQAQEHNLLEGWHRLWLVFAAFIAVAAAWNAFHKWRAEKPS